MGVSPSNPRDAPLGLLFSRKKSNQKCARRGAAPPWVSPLRVGVPAQLFGVLTRRCAGSPGGPRPCADWLSVIWLTQAGAWTRNKTGCAVLTKDETLTSDFPCRPCHPVVPPIFGFRLGQAPYGIRKSADFVAPGHSPPRELPRCRLCRRKEEFAPRLMPRELYGGSGGWKAWRAGALCRLDPAFHPPGALLPTFPVWEK